MPISLPGKPFRLFTILAVVAVVIIAASVERYNARGVDQAGFSVSLDRMDDSVPILVYVVDSPSIDIGGLSSDPELEFRVNNGYLRAVRNSRGDLIVIDVDRLLIFDSTGSALSSVGIYGSGPGEFQNLTSVCTAASDTIVVWDSSNRQTTILDPKGGIIWSFRAPTPQSSLPLDACSSDGTIIYQALTRRTQGELSKLVVSRVKLDGTAIQPEIVFDVTPPNALVQRWLTVLRSGEWIVVGDGIANRFVMRNTNGGGRVVRTLGSVETVGPDELKQLARRSLPQHASAAQISVRLQRVKKMLDDPLTWPAYGRILSDGAGTLWVEAAARHRSPAQVWTAFNEKGGILGRLTVPDSLGGYSQFRVVGFGPDEVLGYARDSDGALRLLVAGYQAH